MLWNGLSRGLVAAGRGVAWVIASFAVTLGWLTVALLLLANLGRGWVPTAALLVFAAVAVVSFVWKPLHRVRPLASDWERFQRRRAERQQRIAAYNHGVRMGVVDKLDEDTLEWAMRRPLKRLPVGWFVEMPKNKYLLIPQRKAATDEALVKLGQAYAPVIGCPAELARIERKGQMVRFVWPREAPIDLLADPVPFEPTAYAVPDAVTIGRDATGAPFKLNLWDNQTLCLGSSGSGKGSVVWSVMLGLAPAIKAGMVKVYGADLKGGVELLNGAPLFTSIATTYEEAAATIAALRAEVDERLAVMVENRERKHTPTVELPAILWCADEFASLVYSAPDNKAKAAVEQDLKRILSTGRAARINVLALAQDPRVDSIMARSLFTQVVGLRFRTADDARLALGASTVDAGAACHLIPQNQQGTGYAISETGEVERFRAFWCDDETIRARSTEFAAPRGIESDV